MAGEVVHEQCDLGISICGSQLLQVFFELLVVHGLWKLHVQLLALLSGDAREHSHGRFGDPGLIDCHILGWQAVLGPRHRLPSEHGLVNVNNTELITSGSLQGCDHLTLVASVLSALVLPSLFDPRDAPSFDTVFSVNLTQ